MKEGLVPCFTLEPAPGVDRTDEIDGWLKQAELEVAKRLAIPKFDFSQPMTATEIAQRNAVYSVECAAASAWFAKKQDECLRPMLTKIAAVLGGARTVHAKRARKLRKRGESVFVSGLTLTGKVTYQWIPVMKWKALDA